MKHIKDESKLEKINSLYGKEEDYSKNNLTNAEERIIRGFRTILIENDDLNSHMNNIYEPIKGDIYFDGIEIEQFLLSSLRQQRKEILEEIDGGIRELKRIKGESYMWLMEPKEKYQKEDFDGTFENQKIIGFNSALQVIKEAIKKIQEDE